MSGDARSRLRRIIPQAATLIVISLLLLPNMGAQKFAAASDLPTTYPFKDEDRLHTEYIQDGVNIVIDLKLSTNKVSDGSTLTVSATCSALKNGVSQLSNLIISVYWGDVDVVSITPPLSTDLPPDYRGAVNVAGLSYGDRAQASVKWGYTTTKGVNGYVFTLEDRSDINSGEIILPPTYCYDSPTTFTATFRLGKQAPELKSFDGLPIPPIVTAGWGGGPNYLDAGANEYTVARLNPSANDLEIQDVSPIQVVHNPTTLISNKRAALEVLVHSSFTQTVYANFNVTYDFGTKNYIERGPGLNGVPLAPGDNIVYIAGGPVSPLTLKPWMDPDKGVYLYWTKSGLDDKIKIVVDPEKKTGDTDTSNNVYKLSEKIEESKKLNIWVVPIYFPYSTPKQSAYQVDFTAQIKYLQGILPVSDDQFNVELSQAMAWPGVPPLGNTTRLKNWLYYKVGEPLTAAAQSMGYNKLVIVVKDLPPLTNEISGAAIGMNRPQENDVVTIVNYAELFNEGTTAHEVAHTFRLWHPSDFGPNKAYAQRYDVSARDYGKIVSNIMTYEAPPRWIDEGRYESNPEGPLSYTDRDGKTITTIGWNLMSQLKTGADPEVIIASGTIFSNSTASVDYPWYIANSTASDLELGTKGNYNFFMLDSNGKTLGEAGFNSSFTYVDEGTTGLPVEVNTDTAPFVLRIPYLKDVKVVELRDASNNVLARKTISSNSPIVAFQNPGGGQALTEGDNLPLIWSASDQDGDALTYSLSYSANAGNTWTPIAINLADKSFSWDTTGLPRGNYQLLLEANDGINAKNTISGTIIIKPKQASGEMAEIKFVFDKTFKPSSANPSDLALAFDYVEFLDSNKNIVAKLDVGSGNTDTAYTGQGFYGNQQNWEGVDTYAWAGGADKTAYIYMEKPVTTTYLRINAWPYMENNPTRIFLDGTLIATISPNSGWKEYTIILIKSTSTIECSASPSKTLPGEQVTISGTLKPLVQGASMTLTITWPSGQQNAVPLKLDSNGAYSYSFKPLDAGTWSAQAFWPGNDVYLNASSPGTSWIIQESTPQNSGGVPANPFEALATGLIIAIILMANHRKLKR